MLPPLFFFHFLKKSMERLLEVKRGVVQLDILPCHLRG